MRKREITTIPIERGLSIFQYLTTSRLMIDAINSEIPCTHTQRINKIVLRNNPVNENEIRI